MRQIHLVLVFVPVLLMTASGMATEPTPSTWPQFRGPSGDGRVAGLQVPQQWQPDSIQYSVDLPVRGHSSPIIWGDRIFLTGSTGEGARVQRHVIGLDRDTGRLLWDEVVAEGSGEELHKMNSWATPSCTTDGEFVVAFFGPGGLHCFDVDGERVWSRDLGDFPGSWGIGASPVIAGDRVIQNCDSTGECYLLAVDIRTGDDVWKTPREQKPRGGWSTPILVGSNERQSLVLNGEFGITAYDLDNGTPLWNCRSFNGRGTPMPVVGHGLVCVVNGKSGDVYAVRPGGRGDVTESHMAWHTERGGGRDLPSPVMVGETMVAISMGGIATGYDVSDGREIWKQRLGGNFSGSPVVVGSLVYATSENGETFVFRADGDFELLHKNSLSASQDEVFRSSPGVVEGHIFLRSDRRLYCVSER